MSRVSIIQQCGSNLQRTIVRSFAEYQARKYHKQLHRSPRLQMKKAVIPLTWWTRNNPKNKKNHHKDSPETTRSKQLKNLVIKKKDKMMKIYWDYKRMILKPTPRPFNNESTNRYTCGDSLMILMKLIKHFTTRWRLRIRESLIRRILLLTKKNPLVIRRRLGKMIRRLRMTCLQRSAKLSWGFWPVRILVSPTKSRTSKMISSTGRLGKWRVKSSPPSAQWIRFLSSTLTLRWNRRRTRLSRNSMPMTSKRWLSKGFSMKHGTISCNTRNQRELSQPSTLSRKSTLRNPW